MQFNDQDQNTSSGGHYDSFLRSPLVAKGASEQRFFCTEAKVPFKNSTNDGNLPFHSACKTTQNNQYNNENMNRSYGEAKQAASFLHRVSQQSDFYGDRFIPCRLGSNMYEMQFSHEESQVTSGTQFTSQNLNPESGDVFDPIANTQTPNGSQPGHNSNGMTIAGDQNMQVYANLLQQQCLGSQLYYTDNCFENLSMMDVIGNSHDMSIGGGAQPVGIVTSSQPSCFSQAVQNAQLNKSKKSLFKYKNSAKAKAATCENTPYATSPLLNLETYDYASPSIKTSRKIPKMPFKVLDAPQLQDDFYLNLVDWSSTNILAVGLGRAVYIWSACTSRVTKLCEVPLDDSITSVGWSQRGTHLAVGTNSGDTQIWDTNHCKLVRTLTGHLSRVGAVAWNGSIVSTGSRDRNILQRDLRDSNQVVSKLVGHKQEVCGLKWSFDDQQLASGGNDNKLMIWSVHNDQPMAKFSDHTAAVKAIGWSPHQNGLLASGGGTADRCIRFWNTNTLQPINFIDTGSQVCNLMFSKNVNEIVSTHGYSLNQIIMWKYPTMQKVATLTGHTYRVLYLSMSPDGQNIVTGAGDETLRFWSVFPSLKGKSDSMPFGGNSSLFPSSMDIR